MGEGDDQVRWTRVTTATAVECPDCGTETQTETMGPLLKVACPNCNKIILMSGAGAPSVTLTQETTSTTRVGRVNAAVDALADPERQRDLDQALGYVIAALEAIHQLESDRLRGDWSWQRWKPGERELWWAHLGARSAHHHFAWTPIWSYSDGLGSGERWSPDMPKIDSPKQHAAYDRLLENKPIIPSLQAICALLDGSIIQTT